VAGVIAVVGDVVGLVTGDATGTEDGRVTEELVTGDGVAVVVDSGAAAVVLVPSIAPAALKKCNWETCSLVKMVRKRWMEQ